MRSALEMDLKKLQKFGNSHLGAEATNLDHLVIVTLVQTLFHFAKFFENEMRSALEMDLKKLQKFENSHLGAEATNLDHLVIVTLVQNFISFGQIF